MASTVSASRAWCGDRVWFIDLIIAGAAASLALVDMLTSDPVADQREIDVIVYALIFLGAAALTLRRRFPVTVLVVVTVILTSVYLRGYNTFLAAIGLAALYAVAAHSEDRRRGWIAITVSMGALFGAASVSILRPSGRYNFSGATGMLLYLVAGIVVGLVVRNREQIFVDAKRRAATAEADRVAQAERAVATERIRIAREMHDVVAHGMSVIAVQATAAQEIARTDPEKTVEVLSRIEGVARESLAEMRRMLGVLRNGDESSASLTPQPTMNDLTAIIAQSTELGVNATLEISGEERDLPPGVELAAFRIVQESLTNVRKHGGLRASAEIRIDYSDDLVAIEISDDGIGAVSTMSDSGGGNGLMGMRERVDIYGGDFAAGPQPGGGYLVRATLRFVDTRPQVLAAEPTRETP